MFAVRLPQRAGHRLIFATTVHDTFPDAKLDQRFVTQPQSPPKIGIAVGELLSLDGLLEIPTGPPMVTCQAEGLAGRGQDAAPHALRYW